MLTCHPCGKLPSIGLSDRELASGELQPDRLSAAARLFRDAGFLVLENAFTREHIERVRTEHDAALARFLEEKGGLGALEGKTFGKRHIGFFPPLTGVLGSSDLLAHPIACQLMDVLLGDDFRSSFVHTNTAWPGSGHQPVHRDTRALFGSAYPASHPAAILVVNIPLCDFSVVNGSTEVWPGTHWIPDFEGDDPGDLGERATTLPSVRTNIAAGALVLRDLRVWHRGMPNESTQPRTMLALVYQRAWMDEKRITIPESAWHAWSEKARHVFRHNTVVPDHEHRPRTWDHG